ncbi:unnamed protein product [Prorocentrum cordatum]|nr:unnamed protein product [Polarella glacialis]
MTETLSKASVDIFHFAVVFFTVFLIYTISGMLLFGQELLMFSTTERALDATFKIVMGDFDWEEMRRIGRLEAWIWFVTFMLLVNLIMLNMLIAIIMDVYAEVKSSLPADADTLWSHGYWKSVKASAAMASTSLDTKRLARRTANAGITKCLMADGILNALIFDGNLNAAEV